MTAKTRILIVTDSPVLPSGMAETTRLNFSTILDRYPQKYELHQIGLFHCYAVTTPRWPIYPTMTAKGADGQLRFVAEDKYGQRTFPKCAAKLQPDIVFGYGEPQRVAHLCVPPSARRHRLVLYVNFDGLAVAPSCCAHLRNADLIFTKSEFSRNVPAAALPDSPLGRLSYLYSPADTQRFAPFSEASRAELRKNLFPPWLPTTAFVLGWVGRNQWRKQAWLPYKIIHDLRAGGYCVCQRCGRVSLLRSDRPWQSYVGPSTKAPESHPASAHDFCQHCGATDVQKAEPMLEAYLWLHMPEEPDEVWPVRLLEQQFALKRGRDIHYTEGYALKAGLAPADMPLLYNLWDSLLYLSGGEGFGLPAWEAMCCELPVVYTNYSSHGEFLGLASAGLPVDGILQPEPRTCIWRMVADEAQVIAAVRRLYLDKGLRFRLGANGRAFAERYSLGVQAERWHSAFQNFVGEGERQGPLRVETEGLAEFARYPSGTSGLASSVGPHLAG